MRVEGVEVELVGVTDEFRADILAAARTLVDGLGPATQDASRVIREMASAAQQSSALIESSFAGIDVDFGAAEAREAAEAIATSAEEAGRAATVVREHRAALASVGSVQRDATQAARQQAEVLRQLSQAEERIAEDVRSARAAFEEGRAAAEDYTAAIEFARGEAERFGVSAGSDLARALTEAELAIAAAAFEGRELADVMGTVGKESQDAAEAAKESLKEIEAVFRDDMARIKEHQVRGFITPDEARRLGREAAEMYNQGILGVIDALPPGQSMRGIFTEAAGSLKDVEQASQGATINVGRLSQTMGSLMRQTVGLPPVVGQLSSTLGSLALGGAVTTGVLAGLTAIAAAYHHLTRDTREARQEQEEALEVLRRLAGQQRVADLGPGGIEREAAEKAAGRLREINAEIERETRRAEVARSELVRWGEEERSDRTIAEAELRIAALREEWDEVHRLMRAGFRGGDEIQARADEREAERARAAAQRALAERQRSQDLVNDLQHQIDAQERLLRVADAEDSVRRDALRQINMEAAIRQALSTAIEGHEDAVRDLVGQLHQLTWAEEDARRAADDRKKAEEEARDATKLLGDNYQQVIGNLRAARDESQRLLAAHRDGEDAVRELQVVLAGEAAVRQFVAQNTEAQREELDKLLPAIRAAAEGAARASSDLRQFQEDAKDAADALKASRAWMDEWAGAVVSATVQVRGSFGEMAQDVLRQIALVTARLAAMYVLMQAFAPFAGGTGIGAALHRAASQPFGGGRARGGHVSAGTAYVVGEQGPELMIPSASGTVVPATSSRDVTVRVDLSALPPAPRAMTPEAVATDDWWRRVFGALKVDYDDRGGS